MSETPELDKILDITEWDFEPEDGKPGTSGQWYYDGLGSPKKAILELQKLKDENADLNLHAYIWAGADPFTGKQVEDLLRENAQLRADLAEAMKVIEKFKEVYPEDYEVMEWWKLYAFPFLEKRQFYDTSRRTSQIYKTVGYFAAYELARLQTENAGARKVIESLVDWMENAPLDYSNGNVGQGTDEGSYYGWKGHKAEVDKAKTFLAAHKETK